MIDPKMLRLFSVSNTVSIQRNRYTLIMGGKDSFLYSNCGAKSRRLL